MKSSTIPQAVTILLIFATTGGACTPRMRAEYNEMRRAEREKLIRDWLEGQGDLDISNESSIGGIGGINTEEEDEDKSHSPLSSSSSSSLDRPGEFLSERVLRDSHNDLSPPPYSSELPMRAMSRRGLNKKISREDALNGVLTPEVEAKLMSGDFDPQTFNPTQFEENTPEWNLAMINFLLKMKEQGHAINEVEANKPMSDIHKELKVTQGQGSQQPLVCKTAPYNICYRLDENGVLHPLGNRRPVRILRVYK